MNITNDILVKKVVFLLEHFKNNGLDIILKEDIEDVKLLKATREEETISFEEYLKTKTVLDIRIDVINK